MEAASYNMTGMASIWPCFFGNNHSPDRPGPLSLRDDWEAGWAHCVDEWVGAVWMNGTVSGVFLGDELLLSGITTRELETAAAATKDALRGGDNWDGSCVVYWNEAWDPVVNNDTFAAPDSALHSVPPSVDWISVDFYRNQDDAYWAPAVAYPAHIYPKMHAHQFAMTVPQAFGRKNLSKNWIERWREDKKWDEWSVEVREMEIHTYILRRGYVCSHVHMRLNLSA